MVALRALNPPVSPGPGLPVGLLNASRAPFRILPPLPHSTAMVVSGSVSTLIGQCSKVVEVDVAADRGTSAAPWDQDIYYEGTPG